MLKGKKAYICSPLSADTSEGVKHNMGMARFYLQIMRQHYGCRAFASHAYLPLMLNDSIPEERETALRIGMELLRLCDVLIICGSRISSGMYGEIKAAFELGIEVCWYGSKEELLGIRKVDGLEAIDNAVQVRKENLQK